ncbi:hypothetical protein LIER_25342 [Lithospermum erythrorhizon]|uniref:Uncharacterized protein n=1 Tax=Lithospermum erythrorhizon TaxID=34254 RepID=A0AAV3R7M0_LITER
MEDIDWVQEVNLVKIAHKSRSLKRKGFRKISNFLTRKMSRIEKEQELCNSHGIQILGAWTFVNRKVYQDKKCNMMEIMERNLGEDESQVSHVVLENDHGKLNTISSLSKLDDLSFLPKQSSLELAHSGNTQMFTDLDSVKDENTTTDMEHRFFKEAFEDS